MSAYKEFKRDFAFVGVFTVIILALANCAKLGWDDTDGTSRSGLGLYTDAKTGCQYLSAGGSGITPRLDARGQHVGCEQ